MILKTKSLSGLGIFNEDFIEELAQAIFIAFVRKYGIGKLR